MSRPRKKIEMALYIADFVNDMLINHTVDLVGAHSYGEGYRVVSIYGYYVRQELVDGQYKAPLLPTAENGAVVGVELFSRSWEAGKEYHKAQA
jgi:hypothetical protein